MDITTLAAWGEFLGGIAVVVSLVYLAGQIRQNLKLLRASTASTTTAVSNDINSLLVGCITSMASERLPRLTDAKIAGSPPTP